MVVSSKNFGTLNATEKMTVEGISQRLAASNAWEKGI